MIVLSLGAGVQSSTLLLMAEAGEFDVRPDYAVFADTQAEPRAVYEWLDWLEAHVSVPVHRVSQGNLRQHIINSIDQKRSHTGQPPFFVINREGLEGMPPVSGGMLWRKCTTDYKLAPLRRETRRLMEAAGEKHVEQWIGISLDECHRMKPSGVKYITNVYPLVDLRMSRHDCLRWLNAHGFSEPPKSACTFCPYTNNARFREMRDERPDEWRETVEFDKALRRGRLPGVTGEVFIHRQMVPLDEVDLSTVADHGQLDLFGEECEGMCGV